MTVHTLPQPAGPGALDAGATRMGRLKMLAVLLVCAAPVIASYFTYYVVRPEGRRNYGELIEPMRPLPAASATDLSGQSVPLASLKDQWLLLSVSAQGCDARCERHLYLQRQLREGLGRERERLDWVWLRTGSDALPESLKPALSQAQVLQLPRAVVEGWLAPAAGQVLEDHLYLVDPMGNWMMRFPADIDAAKARRDIERLLRASASWDREGRGR